jgi:hypothetical protein
MTFFLKQLLNTEIQVTLTLRTGTVHCVNKDLVGNFSDM